MWAWAQAIAPIDDSAWVADTTKRGFYSNGDGSTTFRLPDWNGIQRNGVNGFTGPDSIPGVFFRGGTGAADMVMALNAAPNITGKIYPAFSGLSAVPTEAAEGAFTTDQALATYQAAGGQNMNGSYRVGINISASRSNAAYGRNSTGEVVPNKVSGVWVVRASGGFTAANTSWSVINADATAPAAGAAIAGGKIISQYSIAGAQHIRGVTSVKGKYQQDAWINFSLENAETNTVSGSAELHPGSHFILPYDYTAGSTQLGPAFTSQINGQVAASMYAQKWIGGQHSIFLRMSVPGDSSYVPRLVEVTDGNDMILNQNLAATPNPRGGAFISRASDRYANFLSYNTIGVDGGAVIETGYSSGSSNFYFFASGSNPGGIRSSVKGDVQFVTGSDKELKKDIEYRLDQEDALNQVNSWKVANFTYKSRFDVAIAERPNQLGFIANDLVKISPETVKGVGLKEGESLDNQEIFDRAYSLDQTALIAKLTQAVQALTKRVQELEAK